MHSMMTTVNTVLCTEERVDPSVPRQEGRKEGGREGGKEGRKGGREGGKGKERVPRR